MLRGISLFCFCFCYSFLGGELESLIARETLKGSGCLHNGVLVVPLSLAFCLGSN